MSSYRSSFYGRRKGRPLGSSKKALMINNLPSLTFDPLVFPFFTTEVCLEIGFGAGDHLIHQAKNFPHVTFIGVEVFENGISSLLEKIQHENLTNILIFPQEVGLLWPHIPLLSLDKLFILFPDPWPKIKQRKRRLINEDSLKEFASRLKNTGSFHMASDCQDYIEDVKTQINISSDFTKVEFLSERPQDWPLTQYNRKAMEEGRPSWYLKAWR